MVSMWKTALQDTMASEELETAGGTALPALGLSTTLPASMPDDMRIYKCRACEKPGHHEAFCRQLDLDTRQGHWTRWLARNGGHGRGQGTGRRRRDPT